VLLAAPDFHAGSLDLYDTAFDAVAGHGLEPGNTVSGGTASVWFSAGRDGEEHGLIGLLRAH
jgi:hypothetical protein